MWEVVGEYGVAGLEGHEGPVTQNRIMNTPNVMITSSKDIF